LCRTVENTLLQRDPSTQLPRARLLCAADRPVTPTTHVYYWYRYAGVSSIAILLLPSPSGGFLLPFHYDVLLPPSAADDKRHGRRSPPTHPRAYIIGKGIAHNLVAWLLYSAAVLRFDDCILVGPGCVISRSA